MEINKYELTGGISVVAAILIIVGLIWFVTYTTEKQSGYYCDYCHKGSYRNKTEVLYQYGNTPCTEAKDSMHHFSWWMTAPQYKALPKYIKE